VNFAAELVAVIKKDERDNPEEELLVACLLFIIVVEVCSSKFVFDGFGFDGSGEFEEIPKMAQKQIPLKHALPLHTSNIKDYHTSTGRLLAHTSSHSMEQ